MHTIEPRVREQIATVLGTPLPDPGTPEFDRLVKHLEEAHPQLARKIRSAPGSEPRVTLPSESFVAGIRRRRLIRTIFTRCFYKPAWPEGLVVDKRRIVGFILVLFAGVFLPAIYLLNGAATRHHLSAGPIASTPAATSMPRSGSATTTELLQGEIRLAQPRAMQGPGPVSPPRSPAVSNPFAARLGEVPPPPVFQIPRVSPTSTDVVPSIHGSPAPQTLDIGGNRVFAFVAPEERSAAPRIFTFGQPDLQKGVLSSASSRADSPTQTVQLPDGGGAFMHQEEPGQHQAGQFLVRPGQVITARLVIGLALAPGLEPSPVLAVSDTPKWCGIESCPQVTWLGQATYVGGHRVQMKITTALVEKHAYSVQAIGFGPDMVAGVPAAMSAKTPTIAAQIIGAAITATSDYLKLLGEQRRVTITSEWFTVTQSANPDFWASFLNRITEVMFSPSRPATVEVAEIAPMTELRLLVLAAQGR